MMSGPLRDLPGVNIANGSLHLFLYTSVVAMAMVRNAMKIPYGVLIRPRNFVYTWMFLESYFFGGTYLAGSLEGVFWFFNVVLGIKFYTGIASIRRGLSDPTV